MGVMGDGPETSLWELRVAPSWQPARKTRDLSPSTAEEWILLTRMSLEADFFPQSLQTRTQPGHHLCFCLNLSPAIPCQTSDLQNCGANVYVVLRHSVCGSLLQSKRKLMAFLRYGNLLHGLWANLSDDAEKQGDGQAWDPGLPGGEGLG